MEIFLAYICLKVFETGSLCCFISSFYLIFLFKSLLKSITLRIKKRGRRFLEGGAFKIKYGIYNNQDIYNYYDYMDN